MIGLLLGTAVPARAAVPAATAAALSTIGELGSRPGATRLPVPVSDQVSASVDVGTGNLMVSIQALSLPGVGSDTGLGLVFNSRSGDTAPAYTHPRWNMTLGAAGVLATTDDGVLYTGGDGYSAEFTAVAGSSTAYTAPAGVKADLVKTGTGYTLTSRTTAEVTTFNADGKAVSMTDRNGNTTTLDYSFGRPEQIVSTRGSTGARTATIGYNSGGIVSGFSQTSGTKTRSVLLDADDSGDLAAFTNAAGKTTEFEYENHRITAIIAPTGARTEFDYATDGKVTAIEQLNTSAGSPGNSLTRFAYPSATATLVAGPNTSPTVSVANGPHTAYTLNASGRVSSVIDPEGRQQSRTYTADFDTLSATRGTGTSAGTTTNTYGANTGQSLTSSQGPGGATREAEYTNTAANTRYLATSLTDDAGNQSLFTYNGAGNPLTSTDALAAEAALTYNTDGTVATATAPGNGTNKTLYGYDTNHQLTSLTPVTGSSLGARAFTYDEWGRTKTATIGSGVTVTYGYDQVGRLTSTTFSDSTAAVSWTYNDNGQVLTRTDGAGTTTYGYDQLGRLTSRVNTAGGGTISYGYDKASNLVSTTDSRGTTEYTYDDSGTPETLIYLLNGVAKTLAFDTDERGRRTDTWLQASPSRATWKAHQHTEYDTTGRITRVTARAGEGDTDNTTVMDLSYCYAANTTAGGTCTTAAASDRSKIQWTKDHVSGAVTKYTYDGAGRLTEAKITGGSTPGTWAYTYDARGNRLTASTPPGNQSLTFNAANQITTSGYTFDGAGNLTADPKGTYTYNGAGQLTKSTKTTGTAYTKTYAGTTQHEMLVQKSPSGNYEFTYGRTDANGLPVIEQIKRDNQTAYVEHDPVTGEPLMLRTSTGMQSLYVHDGTGNPTALITSGSYTAFAYTYDPYGTATLTEDSGGNGAPQNPYTFKNGTQDRATGWVKYGARWYDPTTGRWTQQDTLDAPLDPRNANRYAYAANDPINLADPLGLAAADTCVSDQIVSSAAQGAVGGATGGLVAGLSGGFIVGGPAGSALVGIGGAVAGAVAGGTVGALQGVATGNIGCRIPGAEWVLDL